jgi:hypothetical protein
LPFYRLEDSLIGLAYHYWGTDVVKGNNQLLEEFHDPKQVIPLKMAPMVLFGTLITHLFGGSAGREGTAVQMGAAISDQFSHLFKLKTQDRQILIIIGISAGFASVFRHADSRGNFCSGSIDPEKVSLWCYFTQLICCPDSRLYLYCLEC